MEQNNRQHFAALAAAMEQGAKKPTAALAAALSFDATQSYTFYNFTKKGGRK